MMRDLKVLRRGLALAWGGSLAIVLAGCTSFGVDAPLGTRLQDLLPKSRASVDLDAARTQMLTAMAGVPATTILVERRNPVMLEPMVLLEKQDDWLHFQAQSTRRISLRGVLIAGLHGFGIPLVDLEQEQPFGLVPNSPETTRHLIMLDADAQLRRTPLRCSTGPEMPTAIRARIVIIETCHFGNTTRENRFELDARSRALVSSRQYVSKDLWVDIWLGSP
jgi:hypothetical protein